MDLEELQQKKKELELRRDIARLERNERYAAAAQGFSSRLDWHLLWMVPVTGFCAFLVIAAIHDEWPAGLLIGGVPLLLTLPRWRRAIRRWRQAEA